jgi:hypothetical protein
MSKKAGKAGHCPPVYAGYENEQLLGFLNLSLSFGARLWIRKKAAASIPAGNGTLFL